MATGKYCSDIATELEIWSGKLHKLSNEIDRIPSLDKYKLLSQIEGLHIVMTELDDRVHEMMYSCENVSEPADRKFIDAKSGVA